jgi:hypothetical protein
MVPFFISQEIVGGQRSNSQLPGLTQQSFQKIRIKSIIFMATRMEETGKLLQKLTLLRLKDCVNTDGELTKISFSIRQIFWKGLIKKSSSPLSARHI